METIKKIVDLINQIKNKYRDIQTLSRWKRNVDEDEIKRINEILKKRSDILLEIDHLNANVLPLRSELEQLAISDVLRHILDENYSNLEEVIKKVKEEDSRLMHLLSRKMDKIKTELGSLNQRTLAAKRYQASTVGAY